MNQKSSSQKILLYVLIGLLALRLLSIGLYPLMDSSESRYADSARRMAELNDWITVWFSDGSPFWGKPPFAFWLSALGFKVFGVNEFAARLPHLIISFVISWLITIPIKKDKGNKSLYTQVVLWGGLLFYFTSAAVLTDMSLTLGTTIVMIGVWQLMHEDKNAKNTLWIAAGLTIGLLSKGPLTFVICGGSVLFWSLLNKNLIELLKKIKWLLLISVTLILTLPWYILAELKTPGFLNYFIIGEHWHRYVNSGWTGDKYGVAHAEPHGMIWLHTLVAWLPWPVLAPAFLFLKPEPADISSADKSYWLLWALWPSIFFTLAGNVIWTYVLPGVPAMALFSGYLLDRYKSKVIDYVLIVGLILTSISLIVYVDMCRDGEYAEFKNTIGVVKDYQKDANSEIPLYFYGGMPFSASFYTQGKSIKFDDWADLPTVAYVVVEDNANIQSNLTITAHLKEISRRGTRRLYLWDAKK